MLSCRLLIFSKSMFSKNVSGIPSDPYLAQHFVGPDLGLNYLQRLSANNTIVGRDKVLPAKSVQLQYRSHPYGQDGSDSS